MSKTPEITTNIKERNIAELLFGRFITAWRLRTRYSEHVEQKWKYLSLVIHVFEDCFGADYGSWWKKVPNNIDWFDIGREAPSGFRGSPYESSIINLPHTYKIGTDSNQIRERWEQFIRLVFLECPLTYDLFLQKDKDIVYTRESEITPQKKHYSDLGTGTTYLDYIQEMASGDVLASIFDDGTYLHFLSYFLSDKGEKTRFTETDVKILLGLRPFYFWLGNFAYKKKKANTKLKLHLELKLNGYNIKEYGKAYNESEDYGFLSKTIEIDAEYSLKYTLTNSKHKHKPSDDRIRPFPLDNNLSSIISTNNNVIYVNF